MYTICFQNIILSVVFAAMPSGKRLTDAEQFSIKLFKDEGYSNRQIAIRINRSETVIRNFLKKGNTYGVKAPTKGNKKLSLRQKGQIRHEATQNRLSSKEIKDKLNLPVTPRQISRILSTSPNIKWTKLQGKPRLTAVHREKRLDFAKKYMSWTSEWQKVIFSDEKKFNLDGPDCYSCYWHDLRKHDVVRSKRNFGGGSVMVWGAFSQHGKLPICFITTRMNSQMYIDLLEDVLITHLDSCAEEDTIFQQDNASIHVSRSTKDWFASKNICLLDWPACSPDCNPIENLWGILAGKVYANGRQFANVNDLKAAIRASWSEIDLNCLKNLTDSMPKRIFAVIQSKGGHTKY